MRLSLFLSAIRLTSWIVWPIQWVPFCCHSVVSSSNVCPAEACTCGSWALPCMPTTLLPDLEITQMAIWGQPLLPGTLPQQYSFRNFLSGALFERVTVLVLPWFVGCIVLWGVFIYHRGFIIWGSDVVTDGTVLPTHWSQVSYVAQYSINRDWVLAVDSCYYALVELRRASPVWILHSDSNSHQVQARNCIVRYQHHVDTLYADLVGVGCVHWCSRSCFIILQHDVVPIHHLRDWVLHSCHNAFNCAMGTLNYPIPRWYMGAPKSYMYTPCPCKLGKSVRNTQRHYW